jgi:hypothetical protein
MTAWQREKEERGPGCGGRQCWAASNGPWPSGASGGAIAQQGRAVGRDESRAQCQRWGVGGRGGVR